MNRAGFDFAGVSGQGLCKGGSRKNRGKLSAGRALATRYCKREKRLYRLYENAGYKPIGKEEKIKEYMTIIYYEKIKRQE